MPSVPLVLSRACSVWRLWMEEACNSSTVPRIHQNRFWYIRRLRRQIWTTTHHMNDLSVQEPATSWRETHSGDEGEDNQVSNGMDLKADEKENFGSHLNRVPDHGDDAVQQNTPEASYWIFPQTLAATNADRHHLLRPPPMGFKTFQRFFCAPSLFKILLFFTF